MTATKPDNACCRRWLFLITLTGLALSSTSHAVDLEEIIVKATREDWLGTSSSASEGYISGRQLENRPLLRPAEVLETVPGLIVSQHSGDGKANQYYLRGFNLDHGTDFPTSLLGMPANLPTHAHGQGYTDLQFLIPELVDSVRYRKGPYAADVGDFAAAGSASIDYVRQLDHPFADLGIGPYGYRRALLAGSPQLASGHLLYALEWSANNGPWSLPEQIGKLNGLLRYSQGSKDNGWSLAAMAYRAQWNATDQVPQRAIAQGLISRYGNLDASDGGRSQRYSLSGEWSEKAGQHWSRANAYVQDYRLNLWSNFTFCTLGCNPGPGDQFEQEDRRQVYGLHAARSWYGDWGGKAVDFTLGLQSRLDDIGNVGLYTSTARQRWGTVRQDRIKQGSVAIYAESLVQWHEKLRSVLGWRADRYRFEVASDTPQNSGQVSAGIGSPKLALVFGPWANTEYYANVGEGFHSNDARGVTARINPDFRDATFATPTAASTPLVRAKGLEFGLRSALLPGLHSTLAWWRLDLASELVFVGDAGGTTPSFPSRRHGIEWSNQWMPRPGVTVEVDYALSRARYLDQQAMAGPYIPGAIEKMASLCLSYDQQARWSAGLRLRYFGPRPLLEDNSVRSSSSTLVNLRLAYRIDPKTRLALDVLNLFDRQASDIDYYYASQLSREAAPVNDLHSHPAEPRTLRLSLRLSF